MTIWGYVRSLDSVNVGTSITIPIEGAKEASLRVTASKRGKALGKKFAIIKHKEFGVYEIARIA